MKQYLDAGGMKILVDLVVLAHLHTNKATIPLQVWRSTIHSEFLGKISGMLIRTLPVWPKIVKQTDE